MNEIVSVYVGLVFVTSLLSLLLVSPKTLGSNRSFSIDKSVLYVLSIVYTMWVVQLVTYYEFPEMRVEHQYAVSLCAIPLILCIIFTMSVLVRFVVFVVICYVSGSLVSEKARGAVGILATIVISFVLGWVLNKVSSSRIVRIVMWVLMMALASLWTVMAPAFVFDSSARTSLDGEISPNTMPIYVWISMSVILSFTIGVRAVQSFLSDTTNEYNDLDSDDDGP